MLRRILTLAAALLLNGCGVPDIPYETLEAKYASPASQYADLPGDLRVHYRDQGPKDAPTLVLVHGFSASLHTWEPWVAILDDRYRIISLDLPGHGLTRAPAGYKGTVEKNVAVVDGLTRRLGADRFVLAGNSMGGMVAWNYAMAHPDRLRGLVLIDAAGWPSKDGGGGPPWWVRAMGPTAKVVMKQVDPATILRPGLKSAYGDPALVTPALLQRHVDMVRAPGHRDIMLTQQPEAARSIKPADFAAIRVPTLVLHGEEDKLVPVADGRGFAAAIPGSRLITYPKVGHIPMEQIPARSAADLEAFVSTLP